MFWAAGRFQSSGVVRLVILVEGPTEAGFIDNVLAPHLYQAGHTDILTILAGKRGGGIAGWGPVRRDILNSLTQGEDIWVTMMVDYAGMRHSWPGRRQAESMRTIERKADTVEQAMLACITGALENFYPVRFIPHVVMHEFESLLFSDPTLLAAAIGHTNLVPQLERILDECGSPEEINASYDTFPSRRIKGLAPGYQKAITGVDAARRMGLTTIRSRCELFHRWVRKLEDLA